MYVKGLVVMAVAAALAIPASAQGSVVFSKNRAVWVAGDDGSNPRVVAPRGEFPMITPDGRSVVYVDGASNFQRVSVDGGAATQIGAGITLCRKCTFDMSTSGHALWVLGGNGSLDVVPLDGGPARRAARNAYDNASFSPDGSQIAYDVKGKESYEIAQVPSGGGTPIFTELGWALAPAWTSAGLVVHTAVSTGRRYVVSVVVLDATGDPRRTLARKVHRSLKEFRRGRGEQTVIATVGEHVVTQSVEGARKGTLRMISAATGQIVAKRRFSDIWVVAGISADGARILTIDGRGRLQSVDFRSGARRTLVSRGVTFANAG